MQISKHLTITESSYLDETEKYGRWKVDPMPTPRAKSTICEVASSFEGEKVSWARRDWLF